MRVPRPTQPPRRASGTGRAVPLPAVIVGLAALALWSCGTIAPSATVRPEFAWPRATIELPGDVVDLAPGSSGGMICSPCHAEQASLMTGVVTSRDGLLAVGQQLPPSHTVAYRSADGIGWVPEPGLVAGDDTAALAVAADGERRVIVGRNGADGAAWVSATAGAPWQAADDAALRSPAGTRTELRAIAAGGGRFVAAGSTDGTASGAGRTAAVWTSEDGLAWRRASSGAVFEGAMAFGVAATDGRFVVVGAGGPSGMGPAVVWISDDGSTWTRVESPAFALGPMRGVASTPSGLVAVGFGIDDDRAVVWASPDGATWTAQPVVPALQNGGKAIRMFAVAPDGSRLVAAGWKSDAGNGSGVVWESADGTTWERVPDQVSMSGASLSGASFAGGRPVVVGTSGYPDNDQASAWYEGP